MPDIDPVAFAAAERLFHDARESITGLPALMAEYDAHVTLHGGMRGVAGKASLSDGQDALAASIERHGELLDSIQVDIARMTEAANDARAVVAKMEDPGDRLVLRLYYLVGLTERQIPNHRVDGEKVWHYSPDYVPEKKAVALVHAAPVMRDLGIVAKYS